MANKKTVKLTSGSLLFLTLFLYSSSLLSMKSASQSASSSISSAAKSEPKDDDWENLLTPREETARLNERVEQLLAESAKIKEQLAKARSDLAEQEKNTRKQLEQARLESEKQIKRAVEEEREKSRKALYEAQGAKKCAEDAAAKAERLLRAEIEKTQTRQSEAVAYVQNEQELLKQLHASIEQCDSIVKTGETYSLDLKPGTLVGEEKNKNRRCFIKLGSGITIIFSSTEDSNELFLALRKKYRQFRTKAKQEKRAGQTYSEQSSEDTEIEAESSQPAVRSATCSATCVTLVAATAAIMAQSGCAVSGNTR